MGLLVIAGQAKCRVDQSADGAEADCSRVACVAGLATCGDGLRAAQPASAVSDDGARVLPAASAGSTKEESPALTAGPTTFRRAGNGWQDDAISATALRPTRD